MLRLARVRRHVSIPIETRSLPALARSYPRHFTFYVADPISSIASRPHCKHLPGMTPRFGAGLVIETRSLPNLLVATLATLPSMSLIPISSIPDLWQQEAVRALQQGKDVVVQAPTGSGKTYRDSQSRCPASRPSTSPSSRNVGPSQRYL